MPTIGPPPDPTPNNGKIVTIRTDPSNYTYDYTVDWGDGTIESGNTGDASHVYPPDDIEYEVKISGQFPYLVAIEVDDVGGGSYYGPSNPITKIESWGDIQWESFYSSFSGAHNLTYVNPATVPDLSNVTDLSFMFFECKSLTEIDLRGWDLSNITDLSNMFNFCTKLTDINFSGANLSSVVSMNGMFKDNYELRNVDFTGVVCGNGLNDISKMFNNCNSIIDLDLQWMDVSNVTTMSTLFYSCDVLETINISGWNTTNVVNMEYMFGNCHALTNVIGMDTIDTSNVTNMRSMFYKSPNVDLSPISSWNIESLTNADSMFNYIAIPTQTYDSILASWAQQNVQSGITVDFGVSRYTDTTNHSALIGKGWTLIDYGLEETYSSGNNPFIIGIKGSSFTINTDSNYTYNYNVDWGDSTSDSGVTGDISHTYSTSGNYQIKITGTFPYLGNAGNVDYTITAVFNWGDGIWENFEESFNNKRTLLTVTSPVPPKITNSPISMRNMFNYTQELANIDLSGWDTTNVTSFEGMFSRCNITKIDLSGIKTTNVLSAKNMFSNCNSLTSVTLGTDFTLFSCNTAENMFNYCSKLRTINGMNNLQLTNANNLASMFANCFSLESVDFSGVTQSGALVDINHMFMECNKIQSLDLTNFDVSNVTDFSYLFYNCDTLNAIDVTGWDCNSAVDLTGLFSGCKSLTTTPHDVFIVSSSINSITDMFSGCSSITSVDLSSIDDSNLVHIDGLFSLCTSLTNVNVDSLVTTNSSITKVNNIFNGCTLITSIDLSSWDVSNITEMIGLFSDCTSLTSLNLFGGSTANIRDFRYFMKNCSALDIDLSSLDVSGMIYATSMLDNSGISPINYDSLLNSWSDQTVQNGVAFDAIGLTHTNDALSGKEILMVAHDWRIKDSGGESLAFGIDVIAGDEFTFSVDDLLFAYNYNIDWGDGTIQSGLSSSETHTYSSGGHYIVKVSGIVPALNYSDTVIGVDKIKTIIDWGPNPWDSLSNFAYGSINLQKVPVYPPKVTGSMPASNMYRGCSSLSKIYFDSWSPSGDNILLTSVDNMFNGCASLVDVSGFGEMNFDNITTARGLFSGCTSLFDVPYKSMPSATDVSYMFANCSSISYIGSYNKSFPEAINAEGMFMGCSGIYDINAPIFTDKIENISFMFKDCTSLSDIYNVSWDTTNITTMESTFENCSNLDFDSSSFVITSLTNASNMYNGSAFSNVNYNSLLASWATQSVIQQNVPFHAGTAQYDSSHISYRDTLVNTHGWIISDGGQQP